MAAPEISTKRVAISKANAQMVALVAAASFVTIFCLVAAQAVWSQSRYQAHVITAKEKARDQLKANLSAFSGLNQSYAKFNNAGTNIIGGNKDGNSDNDGNNAKIVLDALPSTYDFPALASSVEKILASSGAQVSSITGTDDTASQAAASPSPQPTQIPFSFSVSNANYATIQQLLDRLQSSIRPIQIDTIALSGSGNSMTATVTAHTFYQPAKSLQITTKVVK